ncbi:hypothetical protein CMU19_04470 [Elizabethkingia anophelis]|nr:hypothetical protein [Elizabethkingia anophelis]
MTDLSNIQIPSKLELDRAICHNSFYYFVREFWHVIIPEAPVWNWHIEYLCTELQKVGLDIKKRVPKAYDLLINIPPGTTKSTIVTIMFPAWMWAIDPTIRIISNSYSGDISTEHAIKSRDIIMSERYKELFPHVIVRKDKSGKQNYDNTANGARYTTSTGGAITGKHAHLIINDDPQNPKQAESEAHRKQSVAHTKTLASRKVDKSVTVTITVMQRLNTKDVSGYLIENKSDNIKHIKLPAEVTEQTVPLPVGDSEFKGKPLLYYYGKERLLDKVRLTNNDINEAKVDLGGRGYNGQFLQNPTSEDGDIVKRDWFKIIPEGEFRKRIRTKTPIHFFLDTAYTESTENDPTGVLAACRIGNDMYITSRIKVRKEFPDLIRFIPEYVSANGYDYDSTVRVEPKANGLSVIQALKNGTTLNITNTPTPKDDKKARLYSVSPKIECGRVYLVEGLWNHEFIDEVCGFPNAPHDEDVDLLCYAINHFLSESSEGISIETNILW